MQALQMFSFNSQLVEIHNSEDQIWFCAADVCKAIGYKNPAKAISDNVSLKHNRRLDLGLPGRQPIFISEAGVYELILRSNLPAAVPFRDWVCEQVLPSIRQTRTYTGRMPLETLGNLMTDLPALIAKENSSPAQRDFKVRDVVVVDYGRNDRREAIILDFLDRYIYVKFLDGTQTDFVFASQIEVKR
ncbi:BRO family protein [Microcoleus sp. MON2_D5]|uniref:BRO family protein n=1 Tax=Microcoleus sp. MON2_D5 TaxID=2818833 RepID=UPI002FCF63D7